MLYPQGVPAFFPYAAILLSVVLFFYLWRTHPKEDAAIPLDQLPRMTGTEIAEYLLNESAWGWRTFGHYNTKYQVQMFVPAEIRAAGKSGDVTFFGAWPNETKSNPVDQAYWDNADIDEGRIWDSRNEFATTPRGNATVRSLKSFGAPRAQVYKHWPRAGIFLKRWAVFRVKIKLAWYGRPFRRKS